MSIPALINQEHKQREKTKRAQDRVRFDREAAAGEIPTVGDNDVFVESVHFTPSTITKIRNAGDGGVNVTAADFLAGSLSNEGLQ